MFDRQTDRQPPNMDRERTCQRVCRVVSCRVVEAILEVIQAVGTPS